VRSIRSYLLTRLLGGTAVIVAGAGAAAYLVVNRSLEAQFDQNLSDRVQAFASIIFQQGEDDVSFEFSDELMPEYERPGEPAYFELWFADGGLLERSNSLGGEDLVLAGEPSYEPTHWTAPLPDGRTGRYVSRLVEVHHVYPEEGPHRPEAKVLLIVVARGREDLVAAQRGVLVRCVIGALVLMLLVTIVAWRSVRKGMEPTLRLASTLDAIRVDALPERLEVGALPRELAPVGEKTDALIRRVADALERERRTTADIAHELRTPISEVLTASEVALRNGRDPEGARRALGTVRDAAWRMGRSVSTLLKLARLEMGAETFDRDDVDLGGVVAESLRSLAAVERERGLQVTNGVAPGERVVGDRDVLRIVVTNLLANAIHHAPVRGSVRCGLERPDASSWWLAVENDAGDLTPEDLPALTAPFWRKDLARADRNRSGLGLALSLALAESTDLELAFELEDGRFRALLGGSYCASSERDSSSISASTSAARADVRPP
jgi:signal transduction histidine kinase